MSEEKGVGADRLVVSTLCPDFLIVNLVNTLPHVVQRGNIELIGSDPFLGIKLL